MTDRTHSLVVVLEKDIRVDDCEGLMCAIAHMRGVVVVYNVADAESYVAEQRALAKLREAIHEVLHPEQASHAAGGE